MLQIWGLCGTDSPMCWWRCIRVWPQSPDPGVPTVRSSPTRSLGPQTAAARIHWSFKCSIENGRKLEHLFLHLHIFWIYICNLIKSIVPSFLLYLQLGVSFPWQEVVTGTDGLMVEIWPFRASFYWTGQLQLNTFILFLIFFLFPRTENVIAGNCDRNRVIVITTPVEISKFESEWRCE